MTETKRLSKQRAAFERGKDVGGKIGAGAATGVGVAFGAASEFKRGLDDRFGAGKVCAVLVGLAIAITLVVTPTPATGDSEKTVQAAKEHATTESTARGVAPVGAAEASMAVAVHAESSESSPPNQKDISQLADVPYGEIILREAIRVDIPWQIIAAVIQQESAFNPKAVSRDGYFSRGLGQFLRGTWTEVTKGKGWTWDDAFIPDKNIWATAQYLDYVRKKVAKPGMTEADVVFAMICAYNWGPNNVLKYGVDRAPAHTRKYAYLVCKQAGYVK